jgi:hypothetical protein
LGYCKIYDDVLTGSVNDQPDHVFRLWITLCLLADRDGVVRGTAAWLGRQAGGMSSDRVRESLDFFNTPDPGSKCPEYEGRRAVPMEGGWFLPSKATYRDSKKDEDLRESWKRWQENSRARRKSERESGGQGVSGECQGMSGKEPDTSGAGQVSGGAGQEMSAQADAASEADAENASHSRKNDGSASGASADAADHSDLTQKVEKSEKPPKTPRPQRVTRESARLVEGIRSLITSKHPEINLAEEIPKVAYQTAERLTKLYPVPRLLAAFGHGLGDKFIGARLLQGWPQFEVYLPQLIKDSEDDWQVEQQWNARGGAADERASG